MANKKKKRRSGSGSRPGGRTATSTQEPRLEAESVRPAPATPGGPNRTERKELARKQREIIRRKIARRRFVRRGFRWLIAAAVVGVVVVLIVRSATPAKLNSEETSLLASAPAAATAAGCGSVQKVQPFDPESADRSHIGVGGGPAAMPPLSSYRTRPPASGPHNPTPLGAGQYADPPPIDQAIHSLEHGAVIIWYDPSALSSQALTDLQTFFNKARERAKLIIAPYNYPDQKDAGKLPTGKQMVLIAWHRMQACNKVSLPVAFQFVDHFDAGFTAGDYQGEAPEPGVGI